MMGQRAMLDDENAQQFFQVVRHMKNTAPCVSWRLCVRCLPSHFKKIDLQQGQSTRERAWHQEGSGQNPQGLAGQSARATWAQKESAMSEQDVVISETFLWSGMKLLFKRWMRHFGKTNTI